MTKNSGRLASIALLGAMLLGACAQPFGLGAPKEAPSPTSPAMRALEDELFPKLADKRSYAARMVSYYLASRTDLVLEDEALFLKVMMYFEWYVDELERDWRIPAHQLASLREARDMLRRELGIPTDLSALDVITELQRLADEIKADTAQTTRQEDG